MIHLDGLMPSQKINEIPSNPEGVYVVLVAQQKRLQVAFYNEMGDLPDTTYTAYDPFDINVQVRYGDTILRTIPKASLIHTGTGVWAVDATVAELATQRRIDYIWNYRVTSSGDWKFGVQFVYVVGMDLYVMFSRLRNQIDKERKSKLRRIGYTDENLMFYIQGGLDLINVASPATDLTIATYPMTSYGQLLIDMATVVAFLSQQVYAIDTDVSYSDQGESFNIDHYSKLQSFVRDLRGDLKTALMQFKFLYVSSGHLVQEMSPADLRITQIIAAGPTGALYRGLYPRT